MFDETPINPAQPEQPNPRDSQPFDLGEPAPLDLSDPEEKNRIPIEDEDTGHGSKHYKSGPGSVLCADQFPVVQNMLRTLHEDKIGIIELSSIAKTLANLLTILRLDPEFGPELRISEMGERIYHHGLEVNTDTFVTTVREYISRNYLGLEFSQENTKAAITTVGNENSFHPVREMFKALPPWDGIPRLESVPFKILKTEDRPLHGIFFKKTEISMVARVMDPGCAVHTIMVLVGDQGTGKSTFIRNLAVNMDWYSCSKLDLKDKDGRLNLHYVWITELAELDTLISRVGDESILKDFITDPRDLYRAPYAPAPKPHPRSSIMVGTLNPSEFLKDKTGSRRYWPMTVQGKIDQDGLLAIREQLWAEAYYRYNQGEIWWLTDEEEAMRIQNAGGYEIEDPLEDFLREALFQLGPALDNGHSLKDMIERLPLELRKVQSQRISNILKQFGWNKKSVRGPENKSNRWFPPKPWCQQLGLDSMEGLL